ncbi:UDP-N-acetylmuramoyl-L-alanyl-D-glutamate--2,6-diaminopimelate ligase [Fluviispira multicolorata]|nr:UDP-N-acetylmuramoyl-L-alanyl-D-glutamate--2,6-diaminopimelate ligase [Fluviispira multicolorata]
MSAKFKINCPKIKIQDIFLIQDLNNIIIKKEKYTAHNNLCEIYLNTKDVDGFLKNTPSTKEPLFIYIARKGNKFDGHTYAEKVLNSGNIFIGNPDLIHELQIKQKKNTVWAIEIISNPNFIAVNEIELAINIIIENSYKIDQNKFTTIGITGTNGKTSVTQIAGQIIEELATETVLRIGTLGMQVGSETFASSHVTTPDYPTLLSIINTIEKNNINKIIMETTSHGLKENRLGNWKVDIAVFTNLTQDHLDYHKTMEDYRISKEKLFSHYLKDNGTAIICTKNENWSSFVEKSIHKDRTLIGIGDEPLENQFIKSYSKYFSKIFYLSVKDKKSSLFGISGLLTLTSNNNLKLEEYFDCPLIGDFQLYNTLCSIACALSLNYDLKKIIPIIKKIKNIPGRLEVVRIQENNVPENLPTVLIDYAHTPDALEKAVLVCKNILNYENKGKLITVFGCGGDRDKTKRALMGKIASELSDITIVTSDNPRTEKPEEIINDIFSGIKNRKNCFKEPDRENAIKLAIQKGSEFDLILVAGKGHEDYQIIGETKLPFSDSQVARSVLLKEKK